MDQFFTPFCERESAAMWLSGHLREKGLDRMSMYCLHITNSLIENGKTLFERIPSETLGSCSQGGRRNVEASLLLRGSSCSGAGNQSGERRKEEERLILSYAKKDRCWYGNAPAFLGSRFKKVAEGGEAEVFFAGAYVYKFINNVYFNSYQTALDRITLHNFFSPETKLFVEGFGVNAKKEFGIVVKQPFIKGSALSEKEIENFLGDTGFKKVQGLVSMTEYTLGDYYLGDMHDQNAVRTPGGNIAMIDIDARLNVPELRCGGHYAIPGLAYSEDAVRTIDGMIRGLVPESVSRSEYVNRYGDDDNLLREQLAATGRYNGSFVELDARGFPRRFTLRVDPEDKDRLLKLRCDSIAAMMAFDRDFNDEERAALSRGLFIRRGKTTYAFDADAGRVARCIEFPLKKKKAPEKEPVVSLHK